MDTGNTLLLDVLHIVDELYTETVSSPRSVGRPYMYPDRKMFKVATIATLKKKHKPCEMYRFLRGNAPIGHACGFEVFTTGELIEQGLDPDTDLADGLCPLPCERTFRRRFPKLDLPVPKADRSNHAKTD